MNARQHPAAQVSALPPIERSVLVSWEPAAAFDRFTAQFAAWWPWRTHSIGCEEIEKLVFECRVGGRIFEQHKGGRRFQWGMVTAFDPPRSVTFSWHPSRDESTAQEVRIDFAKEGTGTRVTLTSTNWERWGKGAKAARRGYSLGWGYVLNVWAGRRTFGMAVLDAIAAVIGLVQKILGGTARQISRAGGEIPPDQALGVGGRN